MVAHLAFDSHYDMQGSGFNAKLERNNWNSKFLGKQKKIKKKSKHFDFLIFSYISNLLKHIGQIIQ